MVWKDTDGASCAELLDIITSKIISNSNDKYNECNFTAEVSITKLQSGSDFNA